MIDTLVQQIVIDPCRFMIVADKGNLKENLDEMYFIIRTGSVERIVKSYSADDCETDNSIMRSCNYSSIIPSPLACKMFSKCLLTILEWNWYERLGDGKNNWSKICHQVLTSSTQVKITSFHVVRRTRKMENARAKRAKLLFLSLNVQICHSPVAVIVMVVKPPIAKLSSKEEG